MMVGEGRLRVRLTREEGVLRARLDRPAAPKLTEWLAGETPEAAAAKIPLVFNLCAAGQEAAARSAFGLKCDRGLDRRVADETLREHALKLCVFWPTAIGLDPERGQLTLLSDRKAFAAALFAPLDGAPEDWNSLERWMTESRQAVAAVFRRVARDWDAAWASAELTLFTPGETIDWASATQDGKPVENTPSARVARTRVMREVEARFGRGLLWRMTACLVEIGLLCAKEPEQAVLGKGLARAARGVMTMYGCVEDGVVTRMRRLSPTDYSLTSGGLIETMLARLPQEADAPAVDVARLAMAVADPCMPYNLEQRHA